MLGFAKKSVAICFANAMLFPVQGRRKVVQSDPRNKIFLKKRENLSFLLDKSRVVSTSSMNSHELSTNSNRSKRLWTNLKPSFPRKVNRNGHRPY